MATDVTITEVWINPDHYSDSGGGGSFGTMVIQSGSSGPTMAWLGATTVGALGTYAGVSSIRAEETLIYDSYVYGALTTQKLHVGVGVGGRLSLGTTGSYSYDIVSEPSGTNMFFEYNETPMLTMNTTQSQFHQGVRVDGLAGSGTRMVVADADGDLGIGTAASIITFGTEGQIPFVNTASEGEDDFNYGDIAFDGTSLTLDNGAVLDVIGEGITVGGDDNDWTTRTDSTIKTGVVKGAHYLNAEEDITMFRYFSNTSASIIQIGGAGDYNAATSIGFYTASDTTTLAGTIIGAFTDAGFEADVIDELNTDAGVTIEGVLVEDGFISLDYISPPASDWSMNLANKQLKFIWAAPVTADGALELEVTGAFTGDVLHIHQHTGNPGAGTHLIHLEADDTDVTPLHVAAAGTISAEFTKGILVDTISEFTGAAGVTINDEVYLPTIGGSGTGTSMMYYNRSTGELTYADAPSGTMAWPDAGIALSTGSTWGTSITDNSTTWDAAQAGHANLTSLAGLTYASLSFVKMSASGTFSLDTNTYLTSETSHSDVVVDGDFAANGILRRSASATYVSLTGSASVDTVETAVTDDDTHLPTSGAVVAYVASQSSMVYPAGSGIPIVVGGASWGTTITDNSTTWDAAQPGHANLTSLSALSYVSASFVKMTAAGTFALDTTVYGSGDVTKVGTPANDQIGVWTGDGTLEGDVAFTFSTGSNAFRIGVAGTAPYTEIGAGTTDSTFYQYSDVSNQILSALYSNTASSTNRIYAWRYGGTLASSAAAPTSAIVSEHLYSVHDGTSLVLAGTASFEVDGVIATGDFDTKYVWDLKEGAGASALMATLGVNGFEYAANHSTDQAANDRWIPDKGYVDSVGGSLEGLSDVSIPSAGATDGDILVYGDSSGVWSSQASYTHPNHSGQVTSVADGATALAASAITAQGNMAAVISTDELLVHDSGLASLGRATVGELQTYMQANLSFGGGGYWTDNTGSLSPNDAGDDILLDVATGRLAWGDGNDYIYTSSDGTINFYLNSYQVMYMQSNGSSGTAVIYGNLNLQPTGIAQLYLEGYSASDDAMIEFGAASTNYAVAGYDQGLSAFQIHTGGAFTTLAAADFSIAAAGNIYMGNITNTTSGNYLYYNSTTKEITYNTTSDIRLKENVTPWEPDSLAFLVKQPLIKFDRIDGTASGEIGWDATTMNELMPSMTWEDDKGYMNYYDAHMRFHFHRSIKQLAEGHNEYTGVIEQQAKRISTLEDELAVIKRHLNIN